VYLENEKFSKPVKVFVGSVASISNGPSDKKTLFKPAGALEEPPTNKEREATSFAIVGLTVSALEELLVPKEQAAKSKEPAKKNDFEVRFFITFWGPFTN